MVARVSQVGWVAYSAQSFESNPHKSNFFILFFLLFYYLINYSYPYLDSTYPDDSRALLSLSFSLSIHFSAINVNCTFKFLDQVDLRSNVMVILKVGFMSYLYWHVGLTFKFVIKNANWLTSRGWSTQLHLKITSISLLFILQYGNYESITFTITVTISSQTVIMNVKNS